VSPFSRWQKLAPVQRARYRKLWRRSREPGRRAAWSSRFP
jgi:hypothetical protein